MASYQPPPYRIKMIEPIQLPSREIRESALKRAHYNLFNLRASEIYIDLLTDSGTGAMSHNQWASMMIADESYANAKSYFRFEKVVSKLTGFKEIIPTHQGRAAENIIFGHLLKNTPNSIVVSNQLFDTTVGHILYNGAAPVDLVIREGKEPLSLHPFKGNMDILKLESFLGEKSEDVSVITLVLTNNAGGGQPISMENIRTVSQISTEYEIPFFLDIARFIENCHFIKLREDGFSEKSNAEIALETCSYADGVWMSAKKDGFANTGGFIALNDENLATLFRARLILFEGFPTYGGLTGRDLESVATGLEEAITEKYVEHRINQVEYLVTELYDNKIPVVIPAGGHAAFINARDLLPHIPDFEFPAQALACEIYLEGGIRSVEIGSFMFGRHINGKFVPANLELVRLAIPRRSYEKGHLDYIVEILKKVKQRASEIKGIKIIDEPNLLRHFTSKLEPVGLVNEMIEI